MRYSLQCAAFIICAGLQAQDTVSVLHISDVPIYVVRHSGSQPGALYYNMHDDENTSVEAMDSILNEYGGVLYELVHSGNRNIAFVFDSFPYEFDPNRVYTDAGIWNEIRKVHVRDSIRGMDFIQKIFDVLVNLGIMADPASRTDNIQKQVNQDPSHLTNTHNQSPLAVTFSSRDTVVFENIRLFSDSLLSLMAVDSQEVVIALHNNKEEGYSMASYRIDSIYQQEALAIYMGWHSDPDDFYFVTERRTYEVLQPCNYHIILQDNTLMTDDGSLSVYCGQRGITYINVEAQHGHLKEQIEMLRFLNDKLFQSTRKSQFK